MSAGAVGAILRRCGAVALCNLMAVLLPLLCAAQSLPFKSYSSDEGLSQSVALSVYQDSGGYLWFGTADGLSRFDGLEFQTFGTKDGLCHMVVRAALEDSSGTLWVGTDDGLSYRTDNGSFTPVPELLGYWVRCLVEAVDGSLWAGTYGNGVARIDRNRVVRWYTTADGLVHNRVRAAVIDRNGRLWLGTYGGGISLYEGGSFTTFGEEQGLGDTSVRALFVDSAGKLYAGTNGGVFLLDGDRFVPYTPAQRLTGVAVTSLLEDHQGRIWIGTRDRGACSTDGDGLSCYRIEHGLADSSITAMLEDREGGLWFATFGGGVSRLSCESFHNYTVRDGLPHGSVQAFAEHAGDLWFGTHGGGLGRLRPDGRFVSYTTAAGLPHNKVFSILADRDGSLWIGTLDGAARFDGERFATFGTTDGLAHETVNCIFRDSRGTLWFGTLGGLTAMTGDEVRSYTMADGLPANRVNHIIEGRQGGLWLATAGGVSHFHGGVFESITREDGLPDGYINRLCERADGTLWIAGASGLYQLDGGMLRTYTTEDGLSHNKCSTIIEDDLGRLWIGTTMGINVFDGESFSAFTAKDGLPSSEVLPGAAFKDSSNRLWFGTVRGATVFAPNATPPQVPPPPVGVVAVEANGVALAPTANPSLEHWQRTLRFEFVGISLTYPGEVVYEYQLKGLDRQPRRTRARFVEYAAVPPGSYTFVVRAGLGTGEWSTTPAIARFSISPPFWQRWWFRLLAGLAVAILVVSAHQAKVSSIHRKKQLLEEVIRERTARLRALDTKKNELLGIVAHDLRSPLGGIQSCSDLLLRRLHEQPVDKDLLRRFLGNINATAGNLQKLVNDLLDVTAIESGRVELHIGCHLMSEILHEREALQSPAAQQKGIDLTIDIGQAAVEIMADRVRISEVLDNLIDNAIKFTSPGGHARVFCEVSNGELITHVKDSGQGLSEQELAEVFSGKRLSARPTAGESSTGLGLVIVKKLVELHSGKVWVESKQDQGSTFSFSLPLARLSH